MLETVPGAARDPEFEALVLAELDAVYGFARKLTGHGQDAEDLAHDALVRACRFSDRFERGTNLKAWLFRIVRNLQINRWREGQRRPRLGMTGADFELLAESGRAGVLEAWCSSVPDPLSAYEDTATGDAIRAAMGRLSPKHRDVVRCCLMEGLTYEEAARVLDVPTGTVMSRLHRGRRQLQKELERHALERGWSIAA